METKMTQRNLWVFLVATIATLVLATALASAVPFGTIERVEVNGVDALRTSGRIDLTSFAGERIPVFVEFKAGDFGETPVEDVRISAWISGERRDMAETERFDVLENRTYSRVLFLDVPSDLDDLEELRTLEISVESESRGPHPSLDSTSVRATIDVTLQRVSYTVDILSVEMPLQLQAGQTLTADVVLKNRGRQFAEDTFLKVRIPALGLESITYFGDLSPVDQGGSVADKEDAVERRAVLRIPLSAEGGLYTVEFEAFNSDAVARLEKKLLVTKSGEGSSVVVPTSSQTFSVGSKGNYVVTLVNKGSTVGVYTLLAESSEDLTVKLSEQVVVVPAGSSRTVDVTASALKEGQYVFSVSVLSEDGQAVSRNTFTASVTGEGRAVQDGVAQSTTLLLTVILAIIFVVLLVVLIVLLTRKPEKKEEFGESYY